LAWKLKQSPKVEAVFVAPGNGGTASIAQNVPIRDNDIQALVYFARERSIDLVVPGPELPLTLGIVDAMREAGIPCFGPTAACARLEGSKSFAKSVMQAAGVPTAASETFDNLADAWNFVLKHGTPLVIKADGLAAGKGVIIAHSQDKAKEALEAMFTSHQFGTAGDTVVIEDYLVGEEVSLLCFCDGKTALPLPSAQDHKAALDGDLGPNTGGMGAYSPAPILPDSELEAMADLTIRPIMKEMACQGTPFTGILYAGLMMTTAGPKVLEYNTRFGDPECQPLLMRLDNDLVDLLLACVNGTLAEQRISLKPEAALGVVVAAEGYPGSYPSGMAISGITDAEALGMIQVFQAGTSMDSGTLVSSGGRVLCVTSLGNNLAAAQTRAYLATALVKMEHAYFRRDIGDKGLNRE
jgi:phosphoribosylamine--glycine ligase